jgi:hypothetical protein
MLDGRFDVGDEGTLDTHVLIDAITSASASAGDIIDEQRYEIGGGYMHQLSRVRIGGQARASYEPDYTSLFGGLRGELELFDKNLVIGAGGSYGHDWIDNSGAPGAPPVSGVLDTFLGSLSVSQILSPSTTAAITYDLSYLTGFQQNPYRSAASNMGALPEAHPETRLRHAVAVGMRRFVEATETTAIVTYRVYADDWGLRAHTPELRVVQDIGESLELGAGYRLHRQSGADFYETAYVIEPGAMPPADVTGDAKLSSFTNHAITARGSLLLGALGFSGTLAEARGELALEYVDQNNHFGNAGIAYASLTVPFIY